jgi:hypothetical protein
MPQDITQSEPLQHLRMGQYDNEQEADVPIIAERIVDITDLCQQEIYIVGQVVIKYGRMAKTIVAQFQQRSQAGLDEGLTIRFYPYEMGIAGLVTSEAFLKRSRVIGCDSLLLAETIFEYAPEQ